MVATVFYAAKFVAVLSRSKILHQENDEIEQ
jgi:hypothetical protein